MWTGLKYLPVLSKFRLDSSDPLTHVDRPEISNRSGQNDKFTYNWLERGLVSLAHPMLEVARILCKGPPKGRQDQYYDGRIGGQHVGGG